MTLCINARHRRDLLPTHGGCPPVLIKAIDDLCASARLDARRYIVVEVVHAPEGGTPDSPSVAYSHFKNVCEMLLDSVRADTQTQWRASTVRFVEHIRTGGVVTTVGLDEKPQHHKSTKLDQVTLTSSLHRGIRLQIGVVHRDGITAEAGNRLSTAAVRLVERTAFTYLVDDTRYELDKSVKGVNRQLAINSREYTFGVRLVVRPDLGSHCIAQRALDIIGRFDAEGRELRTVLSISDRMRAA